MHEFSKITRDFWISPLGKKIRSCELEAKALAFYLMTSPHANMMGIYYLPLPLAAHEIGASLEGVQRGLEALIKVEFCSYDIELEYIWIHEMVISQLGILKKNDNRVKYVNCLFRKLPKISFLFDFYEKYKDLLHLELPKKINLSEAPSKGLQSSFEAIQNIEDRIENIEYINNKENISNLLLGGEQTTSTVVEEKLSVKNLITFPVQTKSSVVFTVPLRQTKTRIITETELDEWQKNYPSVDVRQEIRQLIAWNQANPDRQKTERGINRHIQGWLAHAQQKQNNNGAMQSPISTWDHNMAVINALLEENNGG